MFTVTVEVVTATGRFTDVLRVFAISAIAASNIAVNTFNRAIAVHVVSIKENENA